jgi:4-amino-4-deoxy-L-arabinose transferase-like glycosyltransferase
LTGRSGPSILRPLNRPERHALFKAHQLVRDAVLIAVFALILRLGLLLALGPSLGGDSGYYLATITNTANAGCYCDRDEVTGEIQPYAFRMPLFIVTAAAIMKVLGVPPETLPWPLGYLNLFFGVLTVVLTVWIGTRLGGAPVGRAAGLLMALSPVALVTGRMAQTDTFFCGIHTIAMVAGILALENPTVRRSILWGLWLATAAMTRPIVKYLWIACPLVFLIGRRLSLRAAIRHSLLVAGTVGLVLGLWAWRNYVQLGFFGLELNMGINLLWKTHHLVDAPSPEQRRTDPLEARARDVIRAGNLPSLSLIEFRRQTGLTLVEADRIFLRIGLEVMRHKPLAWVGCYGKNAVNFVSSPGGVQELLRLANWSDAAVEEPAAVLWKRQRFGLVAVNWGTRLLLCVLFIGVAGRGAGRLWKIRDRRSQLALVVITILYHLALTSAVAGYDRYRLAVEPLWFVLVAAGIFASGPHPPPASVSPTSS